eukprot:GHVS01073651.1.p1 GENE.GHVS01073651.1~~GHVS01073651.1.p1  ORF type:complete len:995 (-),score=94.92 GHVS01073651.1:22-3006(-)
MSTRNFVHEEAKEACDKIENGKHDPTDINEIWFVVDSEFVTQLRELRDDEDDDDDGNDGTNSCKLPEIRNVKLLNNKHSVPNVGTILKDEVASGLGQNFELVDQTVWDHLIYHYACDAVVPRRVYRNANDHLKVEVQPMCIDLYIDSEGTAGDGRAAVEPRGKLTVSAGETLKHLCDRLMVMITEFETESFLIGPVGVGGSVSEWSKLTRDDAASDRTLGSCPIDVAVAICCSKGTCENLQLFHLPSTDAATSCPTPPHVAGSIVSSRSHGVVGLCNLGNTCFMNSALQCLSKLLPLTEFFLTNQFERDINKVNVIGTGGKLANCYARFLQEMFCKYKEGDAFAPRELKAVIGHYHEQFEGYLQQDSQELLAFLLDGLHEDLNRVKSRPTTKAVEGSDESQNRRIAEESWKRHKMRNDSVVVDMFQGQYRSRLECPDCSTVSLVFDPFMYLTVPVPEAPNHLVHMTLLVGSPSCSPIVSAFRVHGFQCNHTAIKQAAKTHILSLLTDPNLPTAAIKEAIDDACVRELTEENLAVMSYKADDSFRCSIVAPRINFIQCRFKDKFSTGRETTRVYCWIRPKWIVQLLEGVLSGSPNCVSDVAVVRQSADVDPLCAASPRTARKFQPSSLLRCGRGSIKAESNDSIEATDIEKLCGSTPLRDLITVVLLPCKKPTQDQPISPLLNGQTWIGLVTRPQNSPCSEFYDIARNALPQLGGGGTVGCRSQGVRRSTRGTAEEEGVTRSCPDTPLSETAEPTTDGTNRWKLSFPRPLSRKMNYQTNNSDVPTELPDSAAPLSDFLRPMHNTQVSVLYIDYIAEHELSPPVEFNPGEDILEEPTIDRCLQQFMEKEQLDDADSWYCPTCKQHVRASKKIDLWRMPDVLILHLKRFQNSSRFYRSKIDTLVKFPHKRGEVLDMKPHILPDGLSYLRECVRSTFDACYELVAVNCHSGSLGGGHYTANVRVGDRWMDFNDPYVKERDEDELETSEAYLLFYQLVK